MPLILFLGIYQTSSNTQDTDSWCPNWPPNPMPNSLLLRSAYRLSSLMDIRFGDAARVVPFRLTVRCADRGGRVSGRGSWALSCIVRGVVSEGSAWSDA